MIHTSAVVATQDTFILRQTTNLLAERNYSVIPVNSACSSILNILEKETSLVFLDLDMLDNDTMDYIQIIKKTRPKLPVIVMIEDSSIETVRQLVQAGVYYCAIKPFQREELDLVLDGMEKRMHNNEENPYAMTS